MGMERRIKERKWERITGRGKEKYEGNMKVNEGKMYRPNDRAQIC